SQETAVAEVSVAPTVQSATLIREAEEKSQPEWGSFPEISAWAGAWRNPSAGTDGYWVNLKYLQWFTKYEKPENFGIGANVRWDDGKNSTGYDWGFLAFGPSAGYYRALGLRNSFETDVSLLYRIDEKRENGFMPSAHIEFGHRLDYKNRLTFQVDGNYFPNDSWMGPGIYWEYKINKEWKVITGAGASISWLDGDVYTGFMPSVRVKYKNRYNIGVNLNLFTGLGTFYGLTAAYELTPDINTWWENKKDKSVSLVSEGEQVVQNQEQVASDQGVEQTVEISEKTIEQIIQENEEEK
ncbi:MAG TPA: hypothetical protein DEA27_00865, partial [Candidatus Moranbacteria bacterium]|nr:hypothetical protein [Candidatus Moranbacteria bacterium]